MNPWYYDSKSIFYINTMDTYIPTFATRNREANCVVIYLNQTNLHIILWLIAHVVDFESWTYSPGASAQKSCQPGKKCRKLKFSGKLLGCPLDTTVKSPKKSQWRKFFYSRWPPSPLVAYCYTLKSCKFLNICHRKTILWCIPMFWTTENTVEPLFKH